MQIQGLHHITLVCSNAQRTVNFYTGVMGLRFVKKTANFDDLGSYRLYLGDEIGRPGFLVDEARDFLGQELMLPPWLEKHRSQIEPALKPISAPNWQPLEVPA